MAGKYESDLSQQLIATLMRRFETAKQKFPDYFWEDLSIFFSSFAPEHWKPIIEEANKNYKYNTLPKIGIYYKEAEELKVYVRKKNSIGTKHYAFRCRSCGTLYSFRSRGCPNCHKLSERTVEISFQPFNIPGLQENCFDCKDYAPSVRGPVCKDFGNEYPEDKEACRHCGCINCCHEVCAVRKGTHVNIGFEIPDKKFRGKE